jgi:hypothetical protein
VNKRHSRHDTEQDAQLGPINMTPIPMEHSIVPVCFVTVVYDGKWLLGRVETSDLDFIMVHYIKNSGPNRFSWPYKTQNDVDNILNNTILWMTSLPIRCYRRLCKLTDADFANVESIFKNILD